MPLTATGIGSGLDVESLVSQLVLADVQPAEQRINRVMKPNIRPKYQLMGAVKSALASFQTAASSAATASQYDPIRDDLFFFSNHCDGDQFGG